MLNMLNMLTLSKSDPTNMKVRGALYQFQKNGLKEFI